MRFFPWLLVAVLLAGCSGRTETPQEAVALPVLVQMALHHDPASSSVFTEAEVRNVGDVPLRWESPCRGGIRFTLLDPDGREVTTTARPCGDVPLSGVVEPDGTSRSALRFDGRLWNGSGHERAPPGEYVVRALFEARAGDDPELKPYEGAIAFQWNAPAPARRDVLVSAAVSDDALAPGEVARVFVNVTNVGEGPVEYAPACDGGVVAFRLEKDGDTVVEARACEAPAPRALPPNEPASASFAWDGTIDGERAPEGVYVVVAAFRPVEGDAIEKRVAVTVEGETSTAP